MRGQHDRDLLEEKSNGTSIGTLAVTYTDPSNRQTPFIQQVNGVKS